VPYTDEMVEAAKTDLETQADPFGSPTQLSKHYGKVAQRDFDGDPQRITEMDALIAYLQMLGTLVDFRTYEAKAEENRR
jgi:cytochrome c oxidase cbb3-type subunit II